jgi:hypothetical protein
METKQFNQGDTIRLYKRPEVSLIKVTKQEYLLIDVRTNKAAKFKELDSNLPKVIKTAMRLLDNGVLDNA